MKYMILVYASQRDYQRHGRQAGSWRAWLDRGGFRGLGPVHGAVRQGSRRVRGTGGHPRPDRPVAGQADPAGRRRAGGHRRPVRRAEEVLAGYWIVECDSLDRATDIASRLGSAPGPEHVRARANADVRPLAESRHELDG